MNKEFMKFSAEKPQPALIPQEAIDALANVLSYGAKKYSPNNWKKCKDMVVYENALLRHLGAWRRGEKVDEESGMPHLHHALTNLAFLVYMESKQRRNK